MRPIRVALTWVAVLPGLAQAITYFNPELTDRPSARIRMVTTFPERTVAVKVNGDCAPDIRGYDRHETMAYLDAKKGIFGGIRAETAHRQRQNMPVTETREEVSFTEQRIPAGEPLALGFYAYWEHGSMAGSCGAGFSFVPKNGADYEAVFSSPGPKKCAFVLNQIESVPGGAPNVVPVQDIKVLPSCKR